MVSVILKNWVIFVSKSVEKLTKGVVAELNDTIVVLDTETTGLDFTRERIIEFAAVRLENGKIKDEFQTLINPKQHLYVQACLSRCAYI